VIKQCQKMNQRGQFFWIDDTKKSLILCLDLYVILSFIKYACRTNVRITELDSETKFLSGETRPFRNFPQFCPDLLLTFCKFSEKSVRIGIPLPEVLRFQGPQAQKKVNVPCGVDAIVDRCNYSPTTCTLV